MLENIYEKFIKKVFTLNNLLNLIIAIVMIYFIFRRIDLGSIIKYDFNTSQNDICDSGFFLKSVLNFQDFNSADNLGLMKNRAYMWFLLLVHYLQIDLHTAVSLMWVIAGLLFFIVVYKFLKNKILAALSFIYIVCHPIAFFVTQHISLYRNIIYVPSLFITLSLLFILFYELIFNKKIGRSIVLSIITGLAIIFLYFLSETGQVFIMVIGALIFVFLIYDIVRYSKFSVKTFIILLLPLIIFFVGHISYKVVNYRVWGVYEENMRTTGEAGRFVNLIQDIDSDDKTSTLVWCSQDQINKACEVSYHFWNNKDFKKHLEEEQLGKIEDANDFQGDFLGWAITRYMQENDLHYPEIEKMLKSINNDLENAFRYGRLKKTKKIKLTDTFGRYTKNEIHNEVIPITNKIVDHIITLRELKKYTGFVGEVEDENREYIKFFNLKNPVNVEEKKDKVESIVDLYSGINKILVAFAIIAFFAYITILVLDIIKYIKKDDIKIFQVLKRKRFLFLVLGIMFVLFFFLYIFAIAWLNTYLYRVNGLISVYAYYYAASSIVFLIFVFIFSIFIILYVLRKLIVLLMNVEPFSKLQEIQYDRLIRNKIFIIAYIVLSAALLIGIYGARYAYINDPANNKKYKKTELEKKKEKDDKILKKIENLYVDDDKKIKFPKEKIVKIKNLVKNKTRLITYTVLCGDSYCGRLNQYLRDYMGYNKMSYDLGGRTIEENYDLYCEAINTNYPILILATSVNDSARQTEPEVFKETLENLFDKALEKNKLVVVHSFTKYAKGMEMINNFKYKTYHYDYIVKKSAEKYENVIYVDINDLVDDKYIDDDDVLHYNQDFYSVAAPRILDTISDFLDLK